MHIGTLVDILQFIEFAIKKSNLSELYQSLFLLCESKTNNDREEAKQKILEKKKEIEIVLVEINPKAWTDNQYRTFIKFSYPDLLGESAILKLNDLYNTHNSNFGALATEIAGIINSFRKIEQEVQQLLAGLEPLIKPGGQSIGGMGLELEEKHHLLFIQFEETLFIKNISQLEKFCRIWNRILASFAYLTQEPVEEIRIHDIESCSITFHAGIKTINAIMRGTLYILKGYKKVLEIRRLQLELDGLSLSNKDEIKNLLEEEVINVVDVISASVTEELIKKYSWTDKFEKDDVFSSVQISLKQTINFIEKGGKINASHSAELREMNIKIINMLKNIEKMELAQI